MNFDDVELPAGLTLAQLKEQLNTITLPPSTFEEMQRISSIVKNVMDAISLPPIQQITQPYQIALQHIQELTTSTDQIIKQISNLQADFHLLHSNLFDHTSYRFLQDFSIDMSFDEFQNLSQEFMSKVTENINADAYVHQEEYQRDKDEILQAINALSDYNTSSKIKDILFENILLYITGIIFKLIFYIMIGEIDFDLGKAIIEQISEWFRNVMQ